MTLADDILTDLTTMMDSDEHAKAGTYSPKAYAAAHPSSQSSVINGIFGMEYVEIKGVETYAPVFDCATSDVSDASHGAKLTIDAVIYTVRGVQPDGTGLTRLVLEAP